jgi:ABC-type dipeptide/oligopeptide/nickel transport system permease subunit
VMSAGSDEYVQTSRLLGASAFQTLVRDVLPNVLGPVIVYATLDFGNAILLLAGLSFLGLGAQPPTAEWGAMVSDGTQYFQFWWMSTFPGLAIFTSVLALNFLGDSLRDALDPQSAWTTRART